MFLLPEEMRIYHPLYVLRSSHTVVLIKSIDLVGQPSGVFGATHISRTKSASR